MSYIVLFTTKEFAETNKPAVKAYVRSIQDSLKWIGENREEALKLLGANWFKNSKPETLALSFNALLPSLSATGEFTPASFKKFDAQTRLVLQDELLRLWQGTGRTIVFVTHDIVEAITLSDRIATFTGVPGSIKHVRNVTLPRPRDVFHIHETPGFATIYDAIWNDLREEILKERGSDAGA